MSTDNLDPRNVSSAEALLSTRPSGIEQRPVAPPSGPKRKFSPTIALGSVVAAGALFAGGLLVGNHLSDSSATSRFPGAPGGFATTRAGVAGPGGLTSGTISAIDGSTLTVTATDGTAVKVATSSTTTVTRSAASDVAGLALGEQVTVIGPTANGAVTAQTISEGTGGMGFGGGAGGPDGQPTAGATAGG
jgi:hypothetical protein